MKSHLFPSLNPETGTLLFSALASTAVRSLAAHTTTSVATCTYYPVKLPPLYGKLFHRSQQMQATTCQAAVAMVEQY